MPENDEIRLMNHLLYDVEELTAAMAARPAVQLPEARIRTLLTDSRKLQDVEKALFFALKGRRDGHEFVADAYEGGVRSFVVDDPDFDHLKFKGANFYFVDNALTALQDLAAAHRSKFDYPVIGITGSNGKTIVKEWLYQLLAPENNIVKSPKSFNSQIGVPLSVWQMNDEHDLAIFEAGISAPEEMEALERIIKPGIGILTNIGEAHAENFASREDKIAEKLKLFRHSDLLIYSCKYLDEFKGEVPGAEKFTWCYRDKADLEVFDDEVLDEKYVFLRASLKGKDVQAVIPFTDQASIENGIICWSTMLALGYEAEVADQRLEKLHPVGMRLEMKTGIANCSVIDDSYSLDLSSLAIALDFLNQQNQHARRTLILSDIPGAELSTVYEQAAQIIEQKGIDRLVGVGNRLKEYSHLFTCETRFFDTTDALLEDFRDLQFYDEAILLKGARSFGFEKVSRRLTQKVHETVLEINLAAVEHNLNYYKSLIPKEVKVMAMVKAFSYGSGSDEVARLLEHNKVSYLAVAYADEGVALRKSGISTPIMVMSPDSDSLETIVDNELQPEIYSRRILDEFNHILTRKNLSNYPVHIKIDTGMRRLGFEVAEIDDLGTYLSEMPRIRIQSVFSHLAASEDAEHDEFTRRQIDSFDELSGKLIARFDYFIDRHIANTSAISRWPDAVFDLVRLGIGLYGIDAAPGARRQLQVVSSLKSSISQIKHIKAGETIGYGRMGVMARDGKIATVKIGYADGYSRRLGNGVGKMLVRGREVATIGQICMDMCMIDITGIAAKEGDEVIIFNDQIRVEDIAKASGTIPYEVLTGISQRVKRVYHYE